MSVRTRPDANDGSAGIVSSRVGSTASRAAEAELRRSEERHRVLVEFLPVALLTFVDGRATYANPAACRMFGARDAQSLQGVPYVDLVHPGERAEAAARIASAAEKGPKGTIVTRRFVGLGGREFTGELTAVRFAEGGVTQVMVAIQDVSARIRAEAEARRRQAETEAIFAAAPVGLIFVDRDLRIVQINERLAALNGIPVADHIGRRHRELLPDLAENVDHLYRRVVETGESIETFEVRASAPAEPDQERDWLVSYHPLRDAGGAVLGVIGVIQEITETKLAQAALRASEAQLRTIADALPVVILYVDKDERYRFINRTAEAWYGRPRSEVIGRTVAEVLGPETYAKIEPYIRRALAGEPVPFDAEVRYPDGVVRHAEFRNVPQRIDGAVVGYFGFITDITDRVAAEERLRQAQKMEAVGQLTGGIAHDFNNLLAVIIGHLDLLTGELPADSPYQARLETAMHAAARGAELTHRLLAFARRQSLQPRLTDLAALIHDVARLMRRTLGEPIEIAIAIAADLWPVMVDRSQLESALLNIALNARDAMPRGGRLAIEARNVELGDDDLARELGATPGPHVVLAVRDTGSGMSPEVLARAFEPFFTTKDVGKGSGLGLSMVYGFVKQSGGHVRLESEPGRGTTVTIYLPRGAGQGDAGDAAPSVGAAPRGRGESILVVEDDPDVRALCINLLESLGYRTLAVASGREATDVIASDARIDLLLCDVVLAGGMSGPDVAREAQRLRPGLRLVFMSGYAEGVLVESAEPLPSAMLISKPFKRSEFARKVRAVLDDAIERQ